MKYLKYFFILWSLLWIVLPVHASNKDIEKQLDKGYAACDEGRYEDCVSIFQEILPKIPDDSLGLKADIYSTLVCCHTRMGHLEQALTYGEKCLKIDEQTNNKEGISSSLSNLASIYLSAHRPLEAEKLLLRSIPLERELNNNEKLAIRLGMLSEVYINMNCPDKALPLAKEALELDQKDGREMKAGIRMSQLGNCLVCLKQPEKALPYLTEALRIHRLHKNQNSLVITLVTMGIANRNLGRTQEATDYLQQAIQEANGKGYLKPLMSAHLELSKIFNETNDPRAYGQLEQYIQIKDSLESTQVQQQISDLEVRYNTYQKEQELIQKELLIQRQRIIYIALGIALLLVLSVTIFLSRLIRLKNQNMQLKDKLMQIVSHDLKNPAIAQQKLLHQLSRLVTKADTETLQQMVNEMAKEADAHVHLLYSLLDWAGLQTGRLRYTPTILNPIPVIEEVIAQHTAQADLKKVKIELTQDESDHIIKADREMLAAMVRNILSNAIKFSYVNGIVQIKLSGKNITIIDQGIGMGNNSTEKGTGLGLQLVEKMAKLNHATLLINKNEVAGTQVSLSFSKNE